MSDRRVHRTPLDRTGPDRGFGNILGRASSSGPDDAGGGDGSAGAGDFVGEGVRVAYQVVEAYLRQGQQVAQQFGKFSYGPLTMANNMPELQTRWMELWTDLAANWFDMLGLLSESVVSPASSPTGRGHTPQHPPAGPPTAEATAPPVAAPPVTAQPVRFAYEIASARPALVHAEFYPGRETLDLEHACLRILESGDTPIGVDFTPRPGERRVLVMVSVPSHQAPGLYTGALVSNGSMVGGISLRLR